MRLRAGLGLKAGVPPRKGRSVTSCAAAGVGVSSRIAIAVRTAGDNGGAVPNIYRSPRLTRRLRAHGHKSTRILKNRSLFCITTKCGRRTQP